MNEKCKCSHSLSDHKISGGPGYGSCSHYDCLCRNFKSSLEIEELNGFIIEELCDAND